MNRIITSLFLALALFSGSIYGQIFYSVNFNNGCASDCIASTYGGWTIIDNDGGVTGGAPNNWFVSCAEEGITPPGCGSSCIGDASLHVGANPGAGGDMGASFNETGATNATFRMAVSPTISTVGYSTITLLFDFIAFGSAACSDDRLQLRLSTDNGATWPVGFQYCLTSVCCGACNGYSQGQWTTYTLALPPAFNNNPNMRVGYHWRNNGNGSGTDPSAAIDDLRLSSLILGAKISSFTARNEVQSVKLNWTTSEELNLNHFEVQRSLQPSNFKTCANVTGKGGNGNLAQYSYVDSKAETAQIYYRIKMVDANGAANYSNIVRVTETTDVALELGSLAPSQYNGLWDLTLWAVDQTVVNLEIHDLQGRLIQTISNQNLLAGENKLHLDLANAAAGAYLLNIKMTQAPKGFQATNLTRKFAVVR